MARLIDANALMQFIEERTGGVWIYKPDFRWAITQQPTVDAVEVVRCKDCKHWADGVAGCTDHVKCCKIGYYMISENGYCVYGERRNDGA